MAGPGMHVRDTQKQGGGLGCDAHRRSRSVLSSTQISSGTLPSKFSFFQLTVFISGWRLEHARVQSAESLFAISLGCTSLILPQRSLRILSSFLQRSMKSCEGKAGREKDTATKEKCSPHQGNRRRTRPCEGLVLTAAWHLGRTSDVSTIRQLLGL